jgi:hypothetical protein
LFKDIFSFDIYILFLINSKPTPVPKSAPTVITISILVKMNKKINIRKKILTIPCLEMLNDFFYTLLFTVGSSINMKLAGH